MIRDARGLLCVVRDIDLEIGKQRWRLALERAQTRDRHPADLELRALAAPELEHRAPGARVARHDDLHLGGVREDAGRGLTRQFPPVHLVGDPAVGLMQRYGWVADKVHRRKLAREAAPSVLPNATEVKIVVSGNARAWRTMLELRCGEGAELEIRRMAIACLRALEREAPALFSDFQIYVADDTQEAARVAYHKV